MSEKNVIAQLLDALVERKKSDDDVLNMLPKPSSQEIGDGFIVWRWVIDGVAVIESVLVTRNSNPTGLEKDKYVVNIQLPESDNGCYAFLEETPRELGQALLSAWNWQHVWKIHAGDFLLELLSQEPVQEPEPFVPSQGTVIEGIDIEPEAVRTTPSFDNGTLSP
jgi:hypothetical protein